MSIDANSQNWLNRAQMPPTVKSFITRFRPFFESGIWAGLTTCSKALSQLIVVKYIALHFSPATLGVTGQAMSLIAILQTLAGGGIANGVIRRFALDGSDAEKGPAFISASFSYGLIFSALFFLSGALFSNQISEWAFGETTFSQFVFWLGLSSFLSFTVSFSQSLLSAKTLVKDIFWANFLGLSTGVAGFLLLTKANGERGVLLGLLVLILGPAVFFLLQLLRQDWFKLSSLKPKWNAGLKKELVPFTLIALIGGALVPVIYVLLRSGIEDKMGWNQVGYWQAIIKVSELLFSFIGLFIASTFYPKVAAAKDSKQAFRQTMIFAFPYSIFLAIALLTIGVFGETVLSLIYSDAYRFLSSDLNILLFGCFFRALGWLCAFLLMARNHLKVYLSLEIISSIALYAICRIGLEQGFTPLIWAQVVHSVLYLVLLLSFAYYLQWKERL